MTPEAIIKNPENAGSQTVTPHATRYVDDLIHSAFKKPRKKMTASDMDDLIRLKSQNYIQQQKSKALFTAIGFTISLLLTIGAFEWKTYDEQGLIDLTHTGDKFEELAEIPLTDQPPPPPPPSQTVQVIFTEVPDEQIIEEIKINLDVEITTEMSVGDDVLNPFVFEPEEEVADEIFTIVEQQPEPKGGYSAFYAQIAQNLYYPNAARRAGIEGKVFIQFIVEPDGSISNIDVAKGIGMGCDEAAINALKNSPKWNPGKQRGSPVRVRMIIPIIFKISK